jgi:hypothetical protein
MSAVVFGWARQVRDPAWWFEVSGGVFGSGGVAVLVDESAADGGAGDWSAWFDQLRGVGVVRRSLLDVSVGPVLVVVGEVLIEESPQLMLVPDEGPIEQFVAYRADPALSERIGTSVLVAGCGWFRRRSR